MKKILLGLLGIVLPLSASANWVGGVSYFNISDDSDGIDISLDGVAASIGYKFESGNNFYFIPSFSYGFGLSDDSVSEGGVTGTIELDNVMGFDFRGQWEFDSGMYLFLAPSYKQLEATAKASYQGYSASFSGESDWEFGFGGGIGYNFNEKIGAEFGYEVIDGSDIMSLGLRVNF